MSISLLTFVKGRHEALENLIKGLAKNTLLPNELIIVLMNEAERELPNAPFPIRQLVFSHEANLPLAAARNFAAKNASGERLIFLDVDCIPSTRLVKLYKENFQPGYLLNGTVRYLKKGFDAQLEWFSDMESLSRPDPVRYGLEKLPHELFWSLNFGCLATDYENIGGFDESFIGYGAEDTDFAFTARRKNIAMKLFDAVAYHQYHEQYQPPLNHFADIVRNAKTFHDKWGKWPMEGWLKSFAEFGLLIWDQNDLQIIRQPSVEEISVSLKD